MHACARHGAFAPSSGVNFQKGERQMNIDYSFSEALKTTNTDGITEVLLIYDIMCQYGVHMDRRFTEASGLNIPETITVIKAIGLFHVHGHQDSCLYRFAPTYIPGVGMVDGEVLETLWSMLNEISQSVRSATLATREEVLDDHMGDSNWKKLIKISAQSSIFKFTLFIYYNRSDYCWET